MTRQRYAIVRNLLRFCFCVFYRHKTIGVEKLPKGAALIAANHASYLDPPLIGISIPEEICYLARKTLFRNRIFAALISSFNAYPINQEKPDHTFFRTILQLINRGYKVLIFPEGERTEGGEIEPLKRGIGMLAYTCDCPVIPIYIAGTFHAWPMHKRFPKLFTRTACIIGDPISAHQFSHLDKKSAQEAIKQKIYETLLELESKYQQDIKS